MNNETQSHALLAIVYRIEIVTLPILILVGSICNVTTFIVMRRRRMRVSSTCFYMAALAVTDTLVLWTGCLNQWFYLIQLPTLVVTSNLTCKLLPFLFVFFADASVWIIVCMSFERYFAVSRPLRASQLCTTRRAKWVLAVLVMTFFLIDGHFLLTLELEVYDDDFRVCHPKMWARHFVGKIFVYIDALKYSAFPFCISFLLSILIIQRVFRAEGISAQLQNRRQLHQYREYSLNSSPNLAARSSSVAIHNGPPNSLNNSRVGRRVTFMLLSVSIAFCIFSAPMSLMQIVQSVSKPGSYEIPLAIGKAVAELCQYINHSCNFFLYALPGRVFRREFVRLFFPTRFGGRAAAPAAPIAKDVPRHARGSLGPKAAGASSSNRHGSLYFAGQQHPPLLKSSANGKQHSQPICHQSFQVKTPLFVDHNASFSLNRKYCRSIKTQPGNPVKKSLWTTLRSLFHRRRQQPPMGNDPFSLIHVFKPAKTKLTVI